MKTYADIVRAKDRVIQAQSELLAARAAYSAVTRDKGAADSPELARAAGNLAERVAVAHEAFARARADVRRVRQEQLREAREATVNCCCLKCGCP